MSEIGTTRHGTAPGRIGHGYRLTSLTIKLSVVVLSMGLLLYVISELF